MNGIINDGISTAQRNILLDMLDNGINSMNRSQEEFSDSLRNFDTVAGHLQILHQRLAADYNKTRFMPFFEIAI